MRKNLFQKVTMFFMLAVLTGMAGCNTEDVDFKQPIIEAPDKVDFDSQGGMKAIEIKSNRQWMASLVDKQDESWVSFDLQSGNGNAKITVTTLPNLGKARTASLKITSSVNDTYVLISQAASSDYNPPVELYRIKFGTGAPNTSPYPYLDEYTGDLEVSGEGKVVAEAKGSGVSLRTSGRLSKGYPGASSNNKLFFGSGTPSFQVDKISTTGKTNFDISFGVSRWFDNKDGVFSVDKLSVSYSTDGENFSPVAYDFTAKYDTDWNYATGSFSVADGTEFIYLKFVANEASSLSFDDLVVEGKVAVAPTELTVATMSAADAEITSSSATLKGSYLAPASLTITEVGVEYKAEGGNYTAVAATGDIVSPFTVAISELAASTKYIFRAYAKAEGQAVPVYGSELEFTTKAEGEAGLIFYENAGNTEVSANTAVNNYPALSWRKEGSGASGVTYWGTDKTDVRKSTASTGKYEGASGGNNIFFGKEDNGAFEIRNINVTGKKQLKLTFGISRQDYPSFATITNETIQLSAGTDGTAYVPLTFTNADTKDWVLATAEFRMATGENTLYIKFSNPIEQSTIRLDDFRLVEGGTGTIEVGGAGTTSVTAGTASEITENSAKVGGTYTLAKDKTATAAGVEYKVSGSADAYTDKAAAAVASPFTVELDGLAANTTYAYKAYVTVDGAKIYSTGQDLTFTTTAAGSDKTYITMARVREYGAGTTINDDVCVKGIVVDASNTTSTPKNYVVQDETAGIAVRFAANITDRFAQGTELEIKLKDVQVASYEGLMQLNNVPVDNATALSVKELPYKEITAQEFFTGKYESQYVGIKNVQVVNDDLGKTFVVGDSHTSIKMESSTGESFEIFTSKYASFGSQVVPEKSGTFKGVASFNNKSGDKYSILPQQVSDWALMTQDRFGVLPNLAFGAPEFSPAGLTVNVGFNDGKITIPYTNATGAESYNVTVTVSGDAANGISGITTPVAKTLAAGNGNLVIEGISGTPTTAGTVTFTINGVTGLTNNTVNVTVQAAGGGAETFSAYWNMTGIPTWGDSPMDVTHVSNTAVSIGGLTKNNFTISGSPGSNNWGGVDFSGNLEADALTNPGKYVTFTVSSATKSVSLSSVSAIIRITKTGPTKTSLQYSLDGTTYTEAGAFEYERPGGTTTFPEQTIDISSVTALQNVASGQTIHFRLVPIATEGTTTGNWYLTNSTANNAFTIQGSIK